MIIKVKDKPKRPQPPPPIHPEPEGTQPFRPRGEDKRRGVMFSPQVREALKRGVETMTAPLAATLGPLGGTVVVAPLISSRSPEILTDAATIARRVLEIPNRYANTGAMLVRHLAWHMREEVGDGSATAVVLAGAMIRGGLRMIAAGANPMTIRRGIEKGVRAAVAELKAMAQPLDSPEAISALARAATGDAELADLIAEIYDAVGVDGTIVVEKYAGTMMDREYVEGVRWDRGLSSSEFVTDKVRQEAVLTDPLIALANFEMTSASQAVPVLERAVGKGAESLAIIAWKIEGEALGTLRINNDKLPVAPITAPGLGLSRPGILMDLAILTGATLIDEKAGRLLEDFRAEDFGAARRLVATRSGFTIVGAKGRQREIRRRIAELKDDLAREKPTARTDMLRKRLANLSGGTAILKIGAITKEETEQKSSQAEDVLRSVRAALEEGTVPGGGAAYLACISAVEALEKATANVDEAAGVHIVAEALAAPLQRIAVNAGFSGSTTAARARLAGPGFGFDALSDRVVDMRQAGIVDPAKVIRVALEMAASTARMVLTTEAVVLTRRRSSDDVAVRP
jgi:chaperonin GroEL